MILQCDTAAACADVPGFIVYLPEPGTITVDGLPLAVPPYVEQVTVQIAEADGAHAVAEPGGAVFLVALALLFLARRFVR